MNTAPTMTVDRKAVFLQAAGHTYSGVGDRHVLIWWKNGTTTDGTAVNQVLQLTGQPGSYNYYAPVALADSTTVSEDRNQQILLGEFSRTQRNEILRLAKSTKFSKTSVVNSCRTWTRDLFEIMVKEGLMTTAQFNKIDTEVPLKKGVPEL